MVHHKHNSPIEEDKFMRVVMIAIAGAFVVLAAGIEASALIERSVEQYSAQVSSFSHLNDPGGYAELDVIRQ